VPWFAGAASGAACHRSFWGLLFPFRNGLFRSAVNLLARWAGGMFSVNGTLEPTARLRTTPRSLWSKRRSRDHSFPWPHLDGTGCCFETEASSAAFIDGAAAARSKKPSAVW
jgi:hypothetical protein